MGEESEKEKSKILEMLSKLSSKETQSFTCRGQGRKGWQEWGGRRFQVGRGL